MKIKVYADTICGWCFIGQTNLEKALENYKNKKIEVEHVPFQLNPDMPESGISRSDYLNIKFGGKELAAPMYASCLLYTSPSPRDATLSRMPSSA